MTTISGADQKGICHVTKYVEVARCWNPKLRVAVDKRTGLVVTLEVIM